MPAGTNPAVKIRRIYELDSLTTPLTQLAGAYLVWDVPLGPVASGYKSYRGTADELGAYLQSLHPPSGSNQLAQNELEAIQYGAAPAAGNPFVTASALRSSLASRDPYAVGSSATVPLAVLDATNTWAKGDLLAYGSAALQNAGAPPPVAGQHSSILVGTADVQTRDEFDYGGYRFVYGRRNDGTSGWTRLQKA